MCRGPVLPIPDIDAWIGPYFRFKCIYGCEQDELKLSKLEMHMKECPQKPVVCIKCGDIAILNQAGTSGTQVPIPFTLCQNCILAVGSQYKISMKGGFGKTFQDLRVRQDKEYVCMP